MNQKIAIIDYGINNISSLLKAFSKINVHAQVIYDYKELSSFKHVVLPGVGSFDWGIKNLQNKGLFDAIRVLSEKGCYILGICLGMQLLLDKSCESTTETKGLSLISGTCKKFDSYSENQIHVPHVGWNSLKIKKSSNLIEGVAAGSDFYFIHSYYVIPKNSNLVVATCRHGIEFAAVLESDNIMGIQFHPEKCHSNGLNILKKFASL